MIGAILDITDQIKANNEINNLLNEKEILLQEVHHRIKNNMTVIKSILSLHAKAVENEQASTALIETGNRINSMAILKSMIMRRISIEPLILINGRSVWEKSAINV